MVEPIHPTANQYGTDVERVSMKFHEFLTKLRNDDGPYPYLTTQYSGEDPDAETIFPPPTNALKDEFPIVPRIMGNLFLQQVNLWVGKSKDGSSSGLVSASVAAFLCLLMPTSPPSAIAAPRLPRQPVLFAPRAQALRALPPVRAETPLSLRHT